MRVVMVLCKSFKMASKHAKKTKYCCWLDEDKALINTTATARPPCKDFYNIFVTPEHVIIRVWKIEPPFRSEKKAPYECKDTYEEFLENEKIQSDLHRMAGVETVNYLINFVKGQVDYLPRVPKPVLLQLIQYLDLEDIARLGQVSKHFRELCNSEELWEKIYRQNCETPITQELLYLAEDHGWKKLFYTNKLQLQMQLRRQAKKLHVDTKSSKRHK